MLDKNDTAYNEYLKWKTEGPSTDWVALIDLSIVHSECRFCIRTGDLHRKQVGEVVTGPYAEYNAKEHEKYKDKPDALCKKKIPFNFLLLLTLCFDVVAFDYSGESEGKRNVLFEAHLFGGKDNG
jgi:hypothetical protein